MTDDTPVPPWLERSDEGEVPSGEGFVLTGNYDDETSAAALAIGAVEYGEASAEKTLPEWLRWRSELAAALGLVEPPMVAVVDRTKPPPGFGPPETFNHSLGGTQWSIDRDDEDGTSWWRCVGESPEDCIARAWALVDMVVAENKAMIRRSEVAQAVAAELRAQADRFAGKMREWGRAHDRTAVTMWADQLEASFRARADELDPKEKP